jgi:3',5'-nucleoside bisphosphate phosphatase
MIDLHMHSTFSDGTFTPEELVAEAQAVGLNAMALTDHDTTGGVPRFLAAAAAAGIRAISGVEVSADPPAGTMHVLGYCVDPANATLIEHLKWIREGRDARNREILQKLNQLGIRIVMDDVKKFAREDIVARPHFAQALVEKGHARDKKDAFDRYLGRGKAAYCERRRLTPEAVMRLIRAAGGVPSLAHPFSLKLGKSSLAKVLAQLKDVGLMGIECYYPEHTGDMERTYLKIARDLQLIPTGGSDFHGAVSAHTKMGTGYGTLSVPDDTIDRIEAARPR